MTAPTAALAVLVLATAACNKEVPKAAEEPRAAATPLATAEPAAAQPAGPTQPAAAKAVPEGVEPSSASPQAASRVSDASFELNFVGKPEYEAGKPGEATITLDAKPPFHVNDKYPYKFKLKETAGLKFPNPVVAKDAAKLEKQRMTMAVGFTPEAAGKHTIAGVLQFSVCTDDKCLIEKRDLSLEVQSK
ncbi:MAG: hypothetical protein M3020_14645 [Myxococcota bacterium]|jgi:hypothetical protein|nr:hypothetical protein [Myxococcota bacterium]